MAAVAAISGVGGAPGIAASGPLWVEQPVDRRDLDALAEVRRRVPGTAIMADEAVGSAEDLGRIVALGAADVINLKVMRLGGLRAAIAAPTTLLVNDRADVAAALALLRALPHAGGGSLKALEAHRLATQVIKGLFERTQLDPMQVDDVIFGQCYPNGEAPAIGRFRAASAWSLSSARRSLTWALAEATCRSGEIPNVLVQDLDLNTGAVFIRGGGRCAPRNCGAGRCRRGRWVRRSVARRRRGCGGTGRGPRSGRR